MHHLLGAGWGLLEDVIIAQEAEDRHNRHLLLQKQTKRLCVSISVNEVMAGVKHTENI